MDQRKQELTLANYKPLSVEKWSNTIEVRNHLALMRTNGQVDHIKTLSIPADQRIPALINQPDGRMSVLTILTAAIGSAFSNLNLRVSMNEDQIVDLADAIIDSAHEDHLSIEDVLLFLRDMLSGKCGKIYDRMDMPTFFEMFEVYRQNRYSVNQRIKEEWEAQFKSSGIRERSNDDAIAERRKHSKALSDHLYDEEMKLKPNE